MINFVRGCQNVLDNNKFFKAIKYVYICVFFPHKTYNVKRGWIGQCTYIIDVQGTSPSI